MNTDNLSRLAAAYGIEPGYHDIWGQWHATSPDTQRALLAAMGVAAGSEQEAEESLRTCARERCSQVLPPVVVLERSALASGARIQLADAKRSGALSWRLTPESGTTREAAFDARTLRVLEELEADGSHALALALPLPADLDLGYHRLMLLDGTSVLAEALLVVAPERCYLPPEIAAGVRLWGTTLQLYGVRSERNAGIGDFGDLAAAVEIWGRRGAALVGTNPLHALSLRDPEHASPYSPLSRLFVNPLYIDIEATDDFAEVASEEAAFAARHRAACEPLRAKQEVDYAAVAAVKIAALERLYAHFRQRHLDPGTRRARRFKQFCDARGEALRLHALHATLQEHLPQASWLEWPEQYRDPGSAAVQRFAAEHAERVSFHQYLQWQADRQLAKVEMLGHEVGMEVGLYTDLAISIDRSGSEAWTSQDEYTLGASVGAPPDDFNRPGQNWGLPPLSPTRSRASGYRSFIATLRANMARAGALRIDHVMWLSRLYWIPEGRAATQGAYVRYPCDDLLGILALESHRHQCLVIGEDLGTVPDELRRTLQEKNILSYRLLLFGRDAQGRFKPPEDYPRRALVAWSTHDLPTFAGWWQEEDIRTRKALGLLTDAQEREQREARARDRAALTQSLVEGGLLTDADAAGALQGSAMPQLAFAVQTFLARTPAAMMVVQLEDVLGVIEQANLPGTVSGHPNWRRKLPLAIEAWDRDERVRELARRLSNQRP